MERKNTKLTWVIAGLVIALAMGIYFGVKVFRGYSGVVYTKPANLDQLFNLAEKEKGTKVYFSDKFGIGFTYLSVYPVDVKIAEKGNKIYVYAENGGPEDGKSIEVFYKDPKLTLEEAISNQFLKKYSANDCAVNTDIDRKLSSHPGFVSATINYKKSPEDGGRCPDDYTGWAGTGLQYFTMDKSTPDRFFFFDLGQYVLASDGTPISEGSGGYDFTHSLKVFK